MLEQRVIGIADDGDLPRRRPHVRRGGKPAGTDESGDNGSDRPNCEKRKRGTTADKNAAATSAQRATFLTVGDTVAEPSRGGYKCQSFAKAFPFDVLRASGADAPLR